MSDFSIARLLPDEKNDCRPSPHIINPPGSRGLLFDEYCSDFFVLPPSIGTVHVVGMNKSPLMDFCPEIQQVFGGAVLVKETVEKIGALLLGALQRDDGPLQRMKVLRVEENQLSKELLSAGRALSEAKTNLLKLQTLWQNLRSWYESCRLTGKNVEISALPEPNPFPIEAWSQEITSANGDSCDVFAIQLNEIQEEATNFLRDRFEPLNRAEQALKRKYLAIQAAIVEALEEWERDKVLVEELQQGLLKQSFDSNTLSRVLSRVSGLDITVLYRLPWDELVNDYMDEDPKAPMGQNWGAIRGFSGKLTLSAAAACMILKEGTTHELNNVDPARINAHWAVNAFIRFPMTVRRSYRAEYNAAKILERIETMTENGGWFTRENAHSLVENSWGEDVLKIDIRSDDPLHGFHTNEALKQIRANIMERVLASVAKPATPPSMPDMPKDRHLPWYATWGWFGCTTSWLIYGVDSVFGSKTAVSNFKSKNNQTVIEEVNQERVFERVVTVTFSAVSPGAKNDEL